MADDLLDLLAGGIECHVELGERPGDNTVPFVKESEEDVLGSDEAVVQEPGFLLGQYQDPTGTIGEALEHTLKPMPDCNSDPVSAAARFSLRSPRQ